MVLDDTQTIDSHSNSVLRVIASHHQDKAMDTAKQVLEDTQEQTILKDQKMLLRKKNDLRNSLKDYMEREDSFLGALRENQSGIVDISKHKIAFGTDGPTVSTGDVQPTRTPHATTTTTANDPTPTTVGAVAVPGINAFLASNGEEEEVRRPGVLGAPSQDEENQVDIDEESAIDSNADLVVAAEVAPDLEELEENMVERLSFNIRNEFTKSAPVAEVVDQTKRRRKLAAGVLCLLMTTLGICLGVAFGLKQTPEEEGPTGNELLPPNQTVVATIPETICYERVPLAGWSTLGPDACQDLDMGGGVSNLVAKSRLWNVPEAELSILNAGEVRADFVEGNFTVLMARTLLPFGDDLLALVNITGAHLVRAMERGIQKLFDDKALNASKSMGAYPYGAGIRYKVDMTQSMPNRLYDVEVNPRLGGDWAPIDTNKVYRVVTNSYLASGGDSYVEFAYHEFLLEDHPPVTLSFVQYCQHHGVLEDVPLEEYSTQHYVHDPYLFDV